MSRTSFWPRLVGLPYERALLWHKCASTFTLIVTGIHGGLMAADYDFNESFSAESNCFGYGNIFGTLIFGAGGLLFLLSQGPVRRVSYRTFSMGHKVLVPAVIVLACLHVSNLIYFLLPSIVLEVCCNRIGRGLQYKKTVRTASAQVIAGGIIELRLVAPHVTSEIVQRGAQGIGSWVSHPHLILTSSSPYPHLILRILTSSSPPSSPHLAAGLARRGWSRGRQAHPAPVLSRGDRPGHKRTQAPDQDRCEGQLGAFLSRFFPVIFNRKWRLFPFFLAFY